MRDGRYRRELAGIFNAVSVLPTQVLADLDRTLCHAWDRAVAVQRSASGAFEFGLAHSSAAAGLCAHRTAQHRTVSAAALGHRPGKAAQSTLRKPGTRPLR